MACGLRVVGYRGGMIISRGRGHIFVHIPKTGGTSMALALEARAMKDDILIGDTPKARRRKGRLADLTPQGRLWKHSTLRDVAGVVSESEMQSLLVWTLIRNPWDRMVSYYHWLGRQTFDHPAVHLAREVSFEAFVLTPAIQAAMKTNSYASYVAPAPAPVYVRLEHLSRDLGVVERQIGCGLEVPHVNTSDRDRDWRGYYSDTTMAAVAEMCSSDIRLGGYSFEKT